MKQSEVGIAVRSILACITEGTILRRSHLVGALPVSVWLEAYKGDSPMNKGPILSTDCKHLIHKKTYGCAPLLGS